MVKELLSWIGGLFRGKVKGLGDRGEEFAARYLKKQGMRIVARQRRKGKGEIDLIGVEGEFVVFVEVRTRTSEAFMTPERSIGFKGKKRTLRKTVRGLMRKHGGKGMRARVDLVAIIWPEGEREPVEVRHHKGVVRVEGW